MSSSTTPATSSSNDGRRTGVALPASMTIGQAFEALPPGFQFSALAFGVFFFFGIHNILQEAMMKIPGFKYGVMLGYMEVVG